VRAIVDLVDSISSTFTRTIWILIIGGVAVVGIVMLMIGVTAPAVVEEVGERAESISEKAIEAAREEQRAHALAQEGWGYSDSTAAASDTGAADYHDDGSDQFGGAWAADSE
jgi:hypothetical protein